MKNAWDIIRDILDNKSTFALIMISWVMGLPLIWRLHFYLDFQQPEKIHLNHLVFFFLGIGLVLLPFLKTVKISNWIEISREVKETKAEMKDFKSEIRQTVSMLSNTVNTSLKQQVNLTVNLPNSEKAMKGETEL
ncbi:MAG: hypothetical protein SFU91_03815 [Chloroherpetonaceae bacterium]|nr:hypothetical protein [Chloroherpetonaceae bacterium]